MLHCCGPYSGRAKPGFTIVRFGSLAGCIECPVGGLSCL